jgi:gluconolactonase
MSAVDREDGLIACHLEIGIWRFDGHGLPTHPIEACVGDHMTNVVYGGLHNRTLFITETDTGSILACELPVPGKATFSHR